MPTVTHFKIDTVAGRAALKPRSTPYWVRLATGHHIGVRIGPTGQFWWARYYDAATGKQYFRKLGDYGRLVPSARYDAAKCDADAWFTHMSSGGTNERLTVREVCERYVRFLRLEGREAAADDAAGRFRRHVYSAPLARADITKLKPVHLVEWRQNLIAAATHGKAAVNRDQAALRAALNWAFKHGVATTNAAWKHALAKLPGAHARRELYLDAEQRRALVEACPTADIRAFVAALCMLPLRPGALAALEAGAFDARTGTLTVGKDKAGGNRVLALPPEAVEFLKLHAKDKHPRAPLVGRITGEHWTKDSWKGPIRDAVKAAGLPAGASAYTVRHSVLTDLIAGGLDLASVATIAGTSIAMLEQHYHHLQADRARDALAALPAVTKEATKAAPAA